MFIKSGLADGVDDFREVVSPDSDLSRKCLARILGAPYFGNCQLHGGSERTNPDSGG